MKEFDEWSLLVEKYSKEYKKYIKICHFCCENLNPQTVNKQCKAKKAQNE